jgi:hypothetical protein
MRSLLAATGVCALVLAAGVGARPATSKLLLGVSGDATRFQAETGQRSAIHQVFLGWGQGLTWGKRIGPLLETLRQIPMLHLGIGNAARRAVITPQDIAAGKGDAYLRALNEGIAGFGGPVYVRPMAEMNNCRALYSATSCAGGSKGAKYAPAAYRAAFKRIYRILHGGPGARRLAGAGRSLAVNPTSRLKIVWNPLAGVGGWQSFYPGDAFVDLVGNDMYGEGADFSRTENEALYAFARSHKKRYALPEWGVSVDQVDFVRYICDFVRGHSAIELAAYFDSTPGSRWDLGPKPQSRTAYRSCITPLGLAVP